MTCTSLGARAPARGVVGPGHEARYDGSVRWWQSFVLWGLALSLALSCDATSAELCQSGEDEDGDGRVDCADSDCWVLGGPCAEVCTSVFDEDGDGYDGCDDPDCWTADGACQEVCDSGEDEDGDGAVDCDDSDCWVASARCVEICDSPFDEDGDGDVSCADSDCWTVENGCPELCGGGEDEDLDGLVDCADSDCFDEELCVPTFARDTQPILLAHCSGAGGACHTDDNRLGGLSFERFDDILLPSSYCAGETKGACSIFRILEPSMPENCLGCVPAADVAILERWLEGGLRP